MTKIILLIATISLILVKWTTTKVCDYNLALETNVKKVNKLNKDELNLQGKASVSYAKEIDCSEIDQAFDYSLDMLLKKIENIIINKDL